MKKYGVRLFLYDAFYILFSLSLFGFGCSMLLTNGFDVWFAYLFILPAMFAMMTIRRSLDRPSDNPDGSDIQ